MQPSSELLQISLFWDEAGFCYASEEISSLEKRSVIQWSENPPPASDFLEMQLSSRQGATPNNRHRGLLPGAMPLEGT